MWIKLHRSLTEWEWFNNSEMVHLFIYLLLKVNYEDKNWQGKKIKRGQAIFTRKAMSAELGLSEQKIRTCLQKLVESKEIKLKPTNKYTLVTICKYDNYQCLIDADEQSTTNTATNQQPTINHQLTTTKEIKEVKNNIYLSAHARVPEVVRPVSIDECYLRLCDDASWKKAVLSSLRSSGHNQLTAIDSYIDRFFEKLRADGETFKHPQDCKKHFVSWMRIILKLDETDKRNHSRKQDANNYALDQYTQGYADMGEQIPDIF